MPKKMAAEAKNLKSLGSRAINDATRYSKELLGKIPNSELAMKMSGSSDKKSKEYKAAMRSLQRYKKGERSPTKEQQAKITKAARDVVKETPAKLERLIPGGTVTVKGVVCYSAECRDRTINVKLSSSAMREFLQTARSDPADGEEALFEFYDAPGLSIQSGKITINFD